MQKCKNFNNIKKPNSVQGLFIQQSRYLPCFSWVFIYSPKDIIRMQLNNGASGPRYVHCQAKLSKKSPK